MDVEAVSEGQGSARLQVRLDVLLVHGGLVLIGQQDHDHVGLGDGLADRLDLKALLLGELDGLGGRAQADDHVNAGVAQVQRMRVALGAVTEDGDLLAIEHGQIGVLLIPDSCCHNRHSFNWMSCRRTRSLSTALLVTDGFHAGLCPAPKSSPPVAQF